MSRYDPALLEEFRKTRKFLTAQEASTHEVFQSEGVEISNDIFMYANMFYIDIIRTPGGDLFSVYLGAEDDGKIFDNLADAEEYLNDEILADGEQGPRN